MDSCLSHCGYSVTAAIDTQIHKREVEGLKIAKGLETLRRRRYRKEFEKGKVNLEGGLLS